MIERERGERVERRGNWGKVREIKKSERGEKRARRESMREKGDRAGEREREHDDLVLLNR